MDCNEVLKCLSSNFYFFNFQTQDTIWASVAKQKLPVGVKQEALVDRHMYNRVTFALAQLDRHQF